MLESAGMKRAAASDDKAKDTRSAAELERERILNTTANDAIWNHGKKRRRSGTSGAKKDGWSCFDDDCQHRAFAMRMERLERTRKRHGEDAADEYAAQMRGLAARMGTDDAESAADSAGAAVAAAEAGAAHADRMAAELVDMVGRRSQFSRPRKTARALQAGQNGGVNERNARFNAKVARAYDGAKDNAAEEIRLSLERGTAL